MIRESSRSVESPAETLVVKSLRDRKRVRFIFYHEREAVGKDDKKEEERRVTTKVCFVSIDHLLIGLF